MVPDDNPFLLSALVVLVSSIQAASWEELIISKS